MYSRILIVSLLTFLFCGRNTFSQIQLENTLITESVVAEDLNVPWEILWGPDNYIWFTERAGRVSRVNPNGVDTPELLLDITTEVVDISESGLLGMALHPNFLHEDSSFVYLVYTYLKSSELTEKVVRYTYEGNTLVSPLLLLDDIPANNNHNGSRLVITDDRKILITTGDAQETSNSQDLNSLAGKILRMNLDGSIPDDNPDNTSLVWTQGHRNAQGLVIAPNGRIYSSEHGENSDDEVNIIVRGRNFGWPEVEGYCDNELEETFCTEHVVKEPIAAWTPTLAVAGIDYFNHPAIPEWRNSILMTTLKDDDLRVLHLSPEGNEVVSEDVYLNNAYGRLRDICISPQGDIYLATSNRDGRANGGFPITADDRIIKLSAVKTKAYLPDHDPLRILVVGDDVNPHGLPAAILTQFADLVAALEDPENGLNVHASADGVLGVPTDNIHLATAALSIPQNDEDSYDVLVYFSHRIPNDANAIADQGAFVEAVEDFIDEGGGMVVFHHGLYSSDATKNGIMEIIGATASGNVPYDDDGQNVINVAPGHFVTTNGIVYSDEITFADPANGIPSDDYTYFHNTPDERYPDFSINGDAGNIEVLFASNYNNEGDDEHILGFTHKRNEWDGIVVAYQPAEYQPNALDDKGGNNFQILANAIIYAAGLKINEAQQQHYNLTVINGSGSGEYEAGAQVTIIAETPEEGEIFYSWTGDIDAVNDVSNDTTTVIVSSDKTITAQYQDDEAPPLAVNKRYTENQGVGIFPNPTKQTLHVTGAKIHSLKIYSVGGQLVLDTNNKSGYIDISHLKSGNYVTSIRLLNGQTVGFRFIKE